MPVRSAHGALAGAGRAWTAGRRGVELGRARDPAVRLRTLWHPRRAGGPAPYGARPWAVTGGMTDPRTPCDVLVVDSDPTRGYRFTALLQDEGFRAEPALGVVTALERLSISPKPRLIAVDLSTLQSSGWVLLCQRMRDPLLRAIPVVALWDAPSVGLLEGFEVVASVSRRDEFDAAEAVAVMAAIYAPSRAIPANDNAQYGRLSSMPRWVAAGPHP